MSANIIEAFLAADVLILLLFREIDDSEYRSIKVEYNVDSVLTVRSVLLLPFYYIPLAFFVLASCVNAILIVW